MTWYTRSTAATSRNRFTHWPRRRRTPVSHSTRAVAVTIQITGSGRAGRPARARPGPRAAGPMRPARWPRRRSAPPSRGERLQQLVDVGRWLHLRQHMLDAAVRPDHEGGALGAVVRATGEVLLDP